jgi:hypothetical protein
LDEAPDEEGDLRVFLRGVCAVMRFTGFWVVGRGEELGRLRLFETRADASEAAQDLMTDEPRLDYWIAPAWLSVNMQVGKKKAKKKALP